MKGYIQLNPSAKEFIMKYAVDGNNLLEGKNRWNLPWCEPEVIGKVWKVNATHNGKNITTNRMFIDAIIDWYDKYAKIYGLDANVLIAQTDVESKYRGWNYSETGAMGLTQFTGLTLEDFIIKNRYDTTPKFTQEEISKLTVGITNISEIRYGINREQLHQNVIDNPELMVKAHVRYMKYIGSRCDYLTSSTLFGYNRGPGLVSASYIDSIKKGISYGIKEGKKDYEEEGVEYVYKIFQILYNYMDYKELKMGDEFDQRGAEIDSSSIYETEPSYQLPSSF